MNLKPKAPIPTTPRTPQRIGMISELAAARRLGVPVTTLQQWRKLARGPMAYKISDHDFMYLDADIRTFEAICLDSFHDLHGQDRPRGVVWRLTDEAISPVKSPGRQRSFKEWLAKRPRPSI